MSLDAIYADPIESGLQRWAANPGPAPDVGFSMTSFLGAGGKGVPAAALETAGSASDLLSAFGTAAGASGGTGAGMFGAPTDDEKKQEAEARDRMLKGSSFDFGPGNVLRKKAEEFAPDPITGHAADQVISGLIRFGAKAVLDIGTMGPLGAIPLGLDEGNTAAQKLRMEGVGDAAAAKVGAVQGAISAAGAVFPLAGKTIAQTIGLVGIGGPGSYMTQEHVSRRILEEAGYQDQASLHNPFDPLGLALSTVIPGAFGALHMRSIKAAPKLSDVVKHIESGGNPNAIGPHIPGQGTAKGEMQVMDATNTDPGFGVTPAKDNSREERARVGRDYLGAMVARYGDQDKALAAYNAGPGTVDAAIKAHGDGWLGKMPDETKKYVAKARKLTGDYVVGEAAKSSEVIDAARVSVLNDTMARNLPDTPDAHAQVMRAADIVGERGGRAAETEIPEPMVTVFHGTPHEFNAFDSAHIGKGEGVQAFGHGIYLAESEGVAGHYRDMLSRAQDTGGSVRNSATANVVDSWVEKAGGDRVKAAEAYSAFAKEGGVDQMDPHLYREVLEGIQKPPGFIYKASIPKALTDRMIDLDAPIERAPKVVQDYFREQGAFKAGQPLSEHMAIDKFASAKFSEAGIPGIKYLDATARADGEGTRNYVVFPGHEGEIRMGERNGEPIAPREANNSLPDTNSVKVAGDEPAKPAKPASTGESESTPRATMDRAIAEQLAKAEEGAPADKTPAQMQREVIDLRKRETVLQKLLDCVEAA